VDPGNQVQQTQAPPSRLTDVQMTWETVGDNDLFTYTFGPTDTGQSIRMTTTPTSVTSQALVVANDATEITDAEDYEVIVRSVLYTSGFYMVLWYSLCLWLLPCIVCRCCQRSKDKGSEKKTIRDIDERTQNAMLMLAMVRPTLCATLPSSHSVSVLCCFLLQVSWHQRELSCRARASKCRSAVMTCTSGECEVWDGAYLPSGRRSNVNSSVSERNLKSRLFCWTKPI
jgi:hypothetical protein